MSGFLRMRQAPSPRRERIKETLAQLLSLEGVSARVSREQDPFGCDDPCAVNPTGHQTIVSCGEVVCWHCSRIFWS